MKKIILSIVAIAGFSLANAQINVPSSPNVSIEGQNPFIDASGYVTFGASEGKGIYFPSTDLTQFTFKTDVLDGLSLFTTAYDGMLVYNTATGIVNADESENSTKGKKVEVTPGFYYFSNPSTKNQGGTSVAEGQWIRLADINPDTNIKYWTLNGNGNITEANITDIANANYAITAGNFIGTTDAKNVTMATNNVARLQIGEVGHQVDGTDFNFVLDVFGKARFREGIVTSASTYPDYVFDNYFTGSSDENPNYKFKKLNEVENFIKENNHLPGVTSIKELTKSENGYNVDNTQLSIQTLEKVEELYLHVIEQQKEIEALKAEIAELKK